MLASKNGWIGLTRRPAIDRGLTPGPGACLSGPFQSCQIVSLCAPISKYPFRSRSSPITDKLKELLSESGGEIESRKEQVILLGNHAFL